MAERVERGGAWWERDDGGNWWRWYPESGRWELSQSHPPMRFFENRDEARRWVSINLVLPLAMVGLFAVMLFAEESMPFGMIGWGVLVLYQTTFVRRIMQRDLKRRAPEAGLLRREWHVMARGDQLSRKEAWDEVRWLLGWSRWTTQLVRHGPLATLPLAMLLFFLSDPADSNIFD